MAVYQKSADLAYKLHQKTLEGSVDWKKAIVPGVYQASFSDNSIQISLNGSEKTNVKISVIDDNENEIESFSAGDIDSGEAEFNPFDIMSDTYEIARRSALGSEQAINKILSELDDDPI